MLTTILVNDFIVVFEGKNFKAIYFFVKVLPLPPFNVVVEGIIICWNFVNFQHWMRWGRGGVVVLENVLTWMVAVANSQARGPKCYSRPLGKVFKQLYMPPEARENFIISQWHYQHRVIKQGVALCSTLMKTPTRSVKRLGRKYVVAFLIFV